MAGSATLAIEWSSTFMNVASDSTIVPIARALPVRGGCAGGGGADRLMVAPAILAVRR